MCVSAFVCACMCVCGVCWDARPYCVCRECLPLGTPDSIARKSFHVHAAPSLTPNGPREGETEGDSESDREREGSGEGEEEGGRESGTEMIEGGRGGEEEDELDLSKCFITAPYSFTKIDITYKCMAQGPVTAMLGFEVHLSCTQEYLHACTDCARTRTDTYTHMHTYTKHTVFRTPLW